MSAKSNGGGKLRKEQKGDTDDKSTNSGEKEKKGMSRGPFGRKKDKDDVRMSSLNPLSPRPPTFRVLEHPKPNNKRHPEDSTLLLGSKDDVNPDGPSSFFGALSHIAT